MRHVLTMTAAAILAGCAAQAPVEPAGTVAADPIAALSEEERGALLSRGAEVLFWTPEQRLERFRSMERQFPGRTVAGLGPDARALPQGTPLPGSAMLAREVEESDLVGLMVLIDGETRFEAYDEGMMAHERWVSFSVAKSVTSILLGAALADGSVASLEDRVVRYLPELAGTAYENVSIADLVTMRSGVRWDENYASASSDIARLYSQPYRPGVDPNLSYIATLERAAAPGTVFNYNTAETNIVGTLVERATRRSLADYAREKVVGPAGLEGDLFWQVDTTGGNIGGCCISLQLSDFARFGQWVMEGTPGRDGTPVVSSDYLDAATRAQHDFGNGYGYGYFWWTYPGEAYGAIGIFGQGIFIDPARELVVAYLSNWGNASQQGRRAEVLAAVERAIAGE